MGQDEADKKLLKQIKKLEKENRKQHLELKRKSQRVKSRYRSTSIGTSMMKLPKKQRGKGGAKKNTLGALGSPQNLVNLDSNIEIDNMQSSNADINALSP